LSFSISFTLRRAAEDCAGRCAEHAGGGLPRSEFCDIGGELLIDAVADDAHGEKRHLVLPADFGHGPRFHIDSQGVVQLSQRAFLRGLRDDLVDRHQSADVQPWCFRELLSIDAQIDWQRLVAGASDLVDHEDVATLEAILQAAGKTG
jgi:hypothetical protein